MFECLYHVKHSLQINITFYQEELFNIMLYLYILGDTDYFMHCYCLSEQSKQIISGYKGPTNLKH